MRRRAAILTAFSVAVLAAAPTTSAGARGADGIRPPVVAAVGDIACKDPPKRNRQVCQYDDVAHTIEAGRYDAFLALGDIQYEKGEYRNFVENYDRSFGSLLPITRPVPGNHDYGTPDGAGYYRYFGDAAYGPGGYYSYDLGTWHVIALNSAVCPAASGCGPGDPQYDWLRRDLEDHPAMCTLAYWHHPRFDWLKYQKADWTQDYEFLKTKPFWDLLSAAGADVVLAGHNHNYSRWRPMDANGHVDSSGIRQFIVGTGGRNLNGFGNVHTKPAAFARGWSGGFGFLRLRLRDGGYDWSFVAADGQPVFTDRGSAECH